MAYISVNVAYKHGTGLALDQVVALTAFGLNSAFCSSSQSSAEHVTWLSANLCHLDKYHS